MNKTSSLLFALTFLAAGCNAPKLSQTISSFGGVTQDTFRMERDLLDHAPYTIPANKTKLYLQDPARYGIHGNEESSIKHESPCIFDGNCQKEIITILGRPYILTTTNEADLNNNDSEEEKQ